MKFKRFVEKLICEERQEDILAFNDKFGNGAYDKFNKLKGRLKNNNISVDIVYHTKNTSVDDMNKLLTDTENRVVKTSSGETKLNRKKVSENSHYVAWDVLDWETSMNMGDGTGWCITGRYETDRVKPSQAKQYFNQYKRDGVDHFVFLMPKGNEEKYCICITAKNFEFWNAEDESQGIDNIPFDKNLIGLEIYNINIDKIEEFTIKDGVLLKCNNRDMTKVVIPDNVTSIGNCAFWGCTGLTSITIGNSVTSIGYSAFYNCTGLTSITIGNGVTSIGNCAFENCTGLTSVTIPDSVTSIGNGAFHWCTGLTSVTIPDSVTSIGNDAFEGCTGLTSITIGNGVTSIGNCAFYWCTGLTSIAIPDSVTSIGYSAFEGCRNLVIQCKKDSYAEKYAKKNNINYKIIS